MLTPNERRVFIDRGETTSECHRWTAQRLLAFVPERSFARETALERVPDSSVSEASYRR